MDGQLQSRAIKVEEREGLLGILLLSASVDGSLDPSRMGQLMKNLSKFEQFEGLSREEIGLLLQTLLQRVQSNASRAVMDSFAKYLPAEQTRQGAYLAAATLVEQSAAPAWITRQYLNELQSSLRVATASLPAASTLSSTPSASAAPVAPKGSG